MTLILTYAYNAAGNALEFSSANGHKVYYSRENRFATSSKLLAYDVSAGLGEELSTRNLGVGIITGIGMLRSVNCPSSLAEYGCVTNLTEVKLIVDPDFNACAEMGLYWRMQANILT